MSKKLMPNLKPAGYRKDVEFFYKRSIMDDPEAPVVAVGYDFGEGVEYQSANSKEEYDAGFPKAWDEALLNLKEVAVNVEHQEYEGVKLAFVSGHEYAAEKILDMDFMREVVSNLGFHTAMVGIPFKGLMIVTDANSSLRFKFPNVIKQYYENPQSPAISPNVFMIQDGDILGMGGEKVGEGSENSTGGNFLISESSEHNYSIKCNASSPEEILEVVNATYNQILLGIMAKKEFGGYIDYRMESAKPLSPALMDKCLSVAKQIEENEMAQLMAEATAKNRVSVRFFYNGNQIAGQTTAVKEDPVLVPDYNRFTEQDLNDEFFALLKIPGATTSVEALTKMTALMKEYESRGLAMPDPKNPPKNKKWWEFWK
jgi:hypothetical protein